MAVGALLLASAFDLCTYSVKQGFVGGVHRSLVLQSRSTTGMLPRFDLESAEIRRVCAPKPFDELVDINLGALLTQPVVPQQWWPVSWWNAVVL